MTERTTLGFECIRFAEDVLELELLPWQKWFLLHALELHPSERGRNGQPLFRFRKVLLLVGRQNGKSTVMQALTLWRMYVDRCSLVIGTAQDLEVAESLWAEVVEMAQDVPELDAEIENVYKGSGKKSLRLVTGESYKVKAASRRGGRGLAGELVLLDELREHQSWNAWAAVTKTTNARDRAQIYGISNAGDASSIVLRYLRNKAHRALGNPDGLSEVDDLEVPDVDVEDAADLDVDDTLGLFEWSAPVGCDVRDRDGWQWSNPALGHLISERTLASDAATDPEWVFRTEVLCQWSDGTLDGPFPAGAWESTLDPESRRAPGAQVVAGIDTSVDRAMTHISFAALRQDGLPHVEVVASRGGSDWVLDWLRPRVDAGTVSMIVGQGKGAAVSPLLDVLDLEGLPVHRWEGADLSGGTAQFFDLVKTGKLRRLAQPVLDVAAATAVPKFTESGAMFWNRRQSPTDIAPLISANAAVWGLLNQPAEVTSAYEDHGLMVV